MEGLAGLFREQNPYDRGIKTTGAVMENSGFAKPFLAMTMGGDVANANAWDQERDQEARAGMTANMGMLRDKQNQEYAGKILDSVIKISQHDAPAATQILAKEAEQNPYLAKFKGIQFNAETTKDMWATVTSGDGQPYQVYLPGLMSKNDDGSAMTTEQLTQKGIIRPIGEAKPDKSTIGPVGPDKFTPQSIEEYNQTGDYSKLVPLPSDGSLTGKDAVAEFRQHVSQLDSLYKAKASIQKGYDPITGQVIPQTQIQDALKSVDPQIKNLEAYVSKTFPTQWSQYKQPQRQPLQTMTTGPEVPLSAAPKALDEATAMQILKQAGGDRNKARLIAKQQGYTF